jgi:uncharacterized protein YjbI with pentapeptide repeats
MKMCPFSVSLGQPRCRSTIAAIVFLSALCVFGAPNPADLIKAKGGVKSLQNANLSGAVLANADMRKVNLNRAICTGADLHGADLTDAQLEGADLTNANLLGANLTRANLKNANLSYASCPRANFTETFMLGCEISTASMPNVLLYKVSGSNTKFPKNMQGATITYFEGTDYSFSDSVDLSNATLSNISFYKMTLRWAKFTNASISFGNFKLANLNGSSMSKAQLTNVDFSNAGLQNVDFRGADLVNVTFKNADMKYAKINRKWSQLIGAAGVQNFGSIQWFD